MKKIKQLGKIGFLALALTFASCSSDSAGNPTGPAGEGTITASVDGSTITTMQLGTFGYVSGSGASKALQLSGSDATGKAFTLQVVGYTGIATYNVNAANGPLAVLTYTATDLNNPQNTNNTWVSGGDGTTGTLTVTEYTDAVVKGTFSFKGVNQAGTFKQISNGSFNVALNQQQ